MIPIFEGGNVNNLDNEKEKIRIQMKKLTIKKKKHRETKKVNRRTGSSQTREEGNRKNWFEKAPGFALKKAAEF